ncbi:MAG: phosphodiester glycosidase family protein [Verrucomicrobiota bacterium]
MLPSAVVKFASPERPVIPPAPPQLTSCEISGIRFEGVAFDARSHRLIVADQTSGPGTLWPDAATAASAHGGLAAINAGFFTPTGQPLGKLVAAGTPTGSWNRASSLGSGVWLESATGTSAILRRESVPATVAALELVQAGPMLVENNQVVAGLEATKPSVRSVIFWDGGTRWWIGRSSPCTLAALARALTAGGPAAWPPRVALNLDGGRSADLWISAAIPGGPLTRRAIWNKPVRNFLILVSR